MEAPTDLFETYLRPKSIGITRLDGDTGTAPSGEPDVAEFRCSDELHGGPAPSTWGFVDAAELVLPYLLDLPARTRGAFTDIAIDLNAPLFPQHPEYVYQVELTLRGEVIATKIFRNFTQRHQFIVSTQLLFEPSNVLALRSRRIAGGADVPCYFVSLFYVQPRRLMQTLEANAIWVFSTARSGSTWLSQDILCWDGQARPMDEPGLGKMFAPLDWIAERFHDLAGKAAHFESGLDYEARTRQRTTPIGSPPFERAFIFAGQENQIWSAQNRQMYLDLLKHTALQHVINEWGVVGYRRVVFKMPNESQAADIIMRAFPGSFMIFLIRDGRDVMKSRMSRFASIDLAETDDPVLRRHAIAFYSHLWNFQADIIQSAFLAHTPERRLAIHYEVLRRNPTQALRRVLDRVGIATSDQELTELVARTTLENIPAEQRGPDKPRQTGQIGGYARVFSAEEIDLMEAIMGPNLRRFGYPLRADAK